MGLQVPECGTAYCIFGHAVMMTTTVDVEIDRNSMAWLTEGQRALGLSDTEAYWLCTGANDREDVQLIAEAIAEVAGERL